MIQFSAFLARNLPAIERRLQHYLNSTLFQGGPLHNLPIWTCDSAVVSDEGAALINCLIEPSGLFPLAFKVFSSQDLGFDFDRFCKLFDLLFRYSTQRAESKILYLHSRKRL